MHNYNEPVERKFSVPPPKEFKFSPNYSPANVNVAKQSVCSQEPGNIEAWNFFNTVTTCSNDFSTERKFSVPPPREFKFSPIIPHIGTHTNKADCRDPANIQNEFGVCGWILTILSYLLIFFTLPISACMCIKVVQEYERAVIFRLGRLMPGGAKGPGIFFIVPCIDTYRKVDLRVLSFEVPPQEILSKDSVTVAVDAVVYFRISNATISVTNVEDAARSTKLLAQTTLRNILGTKTLAEMLSDREAISHQMQTTLDEATEPWGVKVERVEVKDVRLPVQLQRAMAAEAEAAREARAKVIVAEGEQKASRALKEAAEVIAQSPSAIQLRYLQTLNSISAEKNSTIIFPFPIDLLSAFLQRQPPKVEEPPALPKKIRSCCLYKYPDWVQGMVGSEGGGGGHGHSHGGGSASQGAYHPSQAGSGPSTTTTSGRPLLRSMREAQFHSGAPPILAPNQSQTSVSQLEPGSQLGQQTRRPSKPGANSLLKQAIANRMMPVSPSGEPGASTSTVPSSTSQQKQESDTSNFAKVHKTDSNEMSKSVLMNPAWYRDNEGRTGYKTSDWENLSNKQKNAVKKKKKSGTEDQHEEGEAIKELDSDLLSETSASDAKSIDSNLSENSKMDKKAAKALEKERKKKEKELKKQEEKLRKEKEKQEKLEKKNKKKLSSPSEDADIYEKESIELKKIDKNREKAEATITLSSPLTNEKQSQKPPSTKDHSEKTPSSIRKKSETSRKKTATGEPSKQTIGDRRDSNMSVLSRGSFKSVTFNDRVQTREIERNSSISSSEDDAAIMSDDELSRPSEARRKKILTMLKIQMRQEKKPETNDFDDEDDLEDFEEQERLALMAAQQGYDPSQFYRYGEDRGDEEDGEDEAEADRLSENSYYAEDVEGGDIYLRNEHSFLDMEMDPRQMYDAGNSQYEVFDRTKMGSMSKLHGGDDSSNSLLFGYPIPRSASGYFEAPPVGHMNYSYEEAILNRGNYPLNNQKNSNPGASGYSDIELQRLQQIQQLQLLQQQQLQQQHQHKQPTVHVLPQSSPGGQLKPTITQRSIYENVGPLDSNPPSESSSMVVPGSSQQKTQAARNQFFNTTTQTPSNVVSKTTWATSSDVTSRGSTDSDSTIKMTTSGEDEMKKKFVARFGVRKAPMAREEDPADPVHGMGSQESVNSTDSRESVVSAASNKAEMITRRNFNY